MTPDIPLVRRTKVVQMPILGLGVFQVPHEQTEQVVTDALAAAYRAIDTAGSFRNEGAAGRAIAKNGIPRAELFVTTKMWSSPPERTTCRGDGAR